MSKVKFKLELDVDSSFISFMQDMAVNYGHQEIDQWIREESKKNIYEIINENLKDWGYDKYGKKIDDCDEYGNQIDSQGDLVD